MSAPNVYGHKPFEAAYWITIEGDESGGPDIDAYFIPMGVTEFHCFVVRSDATGVTYLSEHDFAELAVDSKWLDVERLLGPVFVQKVGAIIVRKILGREPTAAESWAFNLRRHARERPS